MNNHYVFDDVNLMKRVKTMRFPYLSRKYLSYGLAYKIKSKLLLDLSDRRKHVFHRVKRTFYASIVSVSGIPEFIFLVFFLSFFSEVFYM